MAMSATISNALNSPSPSRLSPSSSLKLHSPFQLHFTTSNSIPRNSVSRLSASSMSIGQAPAPLKTLESSFLDRKESGFVHFVMYHGLGNDFILVDNRESVDPKVTPEQAVKLCDRNFGVGADGVIFAMAGTSGADYKMRIFNSDGSEPEIVKLKETEAIPISKACSKPQKEKLIDAISNEPREDEAEDVQSRVSDSFELFEVDTDAKTKESQRKSEKLKKLNQQGRSHRDTKIPLAVR